MTILESKPVNLPKLGELFVEAGVLNSKVVSECLFTAQHTQTQVGKVLISGGHVSAPDVESALQTQKMLRAGVVTRQSAIRLVRRVHCGKISIEEAQAQELCDRAFSMPFSLVGKLLMASEIISEQTLLAATRSTTQQLPLGRLLVSENAVSQALLINVMNCLILIRDKKISRYQAAQLLRHINKDPQSDLPQALKHLNLGHLVSTRAPRLLDLLTNAQLLSLVDAEWCLEIAVETGRQTGQVLLLYGLVDENLLESALSLQAMLAAGTLAPSRASELLLLCKETETTLESLLAELNHLNLVVRFLRHARVLNEEQIATISRQTPDFENNCGSLLVREGVVSHDMLMESMRLVAEINAGNLTEEQAINSARATYKPGQSFDDTKPLRGELEKIKPAGRLEMSA